ncbi:MAG: hypothetical protein V3R60_08665, partial [Acidobacteriota bacterium]
AKGISSAYSAVVRKNSKTIKIAKSASMKSNTYNCSFWRKGIFSRVLRLCGEMSKFLSAIIGENLRLNLFAGLAQPKADPSQPKADPSSGGVLAFRPGFRPVGAAARRARKTLLKSFC